MKTFIHSFPKRIASKDLNTSKSCNRTPHQHSYSWTPVISRRFSSTAKDLDDIKSKSRVSNGYSSLNRHIVKVEGVDSFRFLQGLATTNLNYTINTTLKEGPEHLIEQQTQEISDTRPIYTTFLNSQGRICFDAFIFPLVEEKQLRGFLIDCDAKFGAGEVIKHLQRFKIRTKVTLSDVTPDYHVWSIIGNQSSNLLSSIQKNRSDSGLDISQSTQEILRSTLFPDPRSPILGLRAILPANQHITLPSPFEPLNNTAYELFRTLHGAPEGPSDFVYSHALPFELNIDYMNAVSFNKGCYLGQELTARTHYTGIIRKKLLPLVTVKDKSSSTSFSANNERDVLFPSFVIDSLDIGMPLSETSLITEDGKKTGKIHSTILNLGMGMVRLEHLNPVIDQTLLTTVPGENSSTESVPVRVMKPFWWDNYVKEKQEKEQKIAEHFAQH